MRSKIQDKYLEIEEIGPTFAPEKTKILLLTNNKTTI
jgi:hypothetical protein